MDRRRVAGLRRRALLLRVMVNLKPAFETLGVGRHIPHAHFAKLRGPTLNPGSVVFSRSLLNSSSTIAPPLAANDHAAKPLGMPENVVISGEAAACDADQMKLIDLQIFHERVQIFLANGARLSTTLRIRLYCGPSRDDRR